MAEVETKPAIDQLPEEMLATILSFLNGNDLKEVAKVNKSWNALVGHPRLIKKLKLCLEASIGWNKIFKDSKNLKRSYSAVVINNSEVWDKDAMNTMRKVGTHLHLLELSNCEFSLGESKTVTKIFRSLPELETLKMYDVDLDALEESELVSVKPLNMEKLKSVVLHESSWAMLEFFKPSQLKSLKINGSLSSDLESYLIDYLASQTKLEELALRDIDFSHRGIEASQIEKLSFPLKKLALHEQRDFLDGEDNAKAFLDRFANTLEQLELGRKFENSFFVHVFEKLQKLQCLDLLTSGLPKEEDFYKTLRNLPSVTKLIIRKYKTKHQNLVQGIIGNLQNVETLIIEGEVSNEMMMFIANNLQKLTSLSLRSIASPNVFKNVIMPDSFKKLSVAGLSSVSGKKWTQICRAMPKVQEVSISAINDLTSFNDSKFNAFTKFWKKLRVLNIGTGFLPTARMFSLLLSRCPHLQTVRIASGRDFSDPAFKGFEKKGLRLILVNPYENHGHIDGVKDCSLWSNEEARVDFDDEYAGSDDDSDDFSSDVDMEQIEALVGGLMFGAVYDPDREDQLYFDSDGEMRYWDEDPADYGFEMY